MALKIGNKVRLRNHPNGVTGIILRAANRGSWASGLDVEYYVKYDQDNLIPPADWHIEDSLELFDYLPEGEIKVVDKKCTCGVDSIGLGDLGHSDWCDRSINKVYKSE